MPERWKQRRGSLQLTSVTMTRLAPACKHCRTSSATASGFVLAACSGVRSQAMLGLITTTSLRPTKRLMPPRSKSARATSAAGSPPCTTVKCGNCGLTAMRWSRFACSTFDTIGRKLCSLSHTPRPIAPAATPPTRSSCSMASRRVRDGTSSSLRSVSSVMVPLPLIGAPHFQKQLQVLRLRYASPRMADLFVSLLPHRSAICERLDFHQLNARRIVDAQLVRGIGGGSNVAWLTARGFQRRHTRLGAFALDHLPGSVVQGHTVLAHDKRIRIPEVLGVEARPALVHRRHGVANGEAHLVADDGNAI